MATPLFPSGSSLNSRRSTKSEYSASVSKFPWLFFVQTIMPSLARYSPPLLPKYFQPVRSFPLNRLVKPSSAWTASDPALNAKATTAVEINLRVRTNDTHLVRQWFMLILKVDSGVEILAFNVFCQAAGLIHRLCNRVPAP